jgi:hypothetical protein
MAASRIFRVHKKAAMSKDPKIPPGLDGKADGEIAGRFVEGCQGIGTPAAPRLMSL